MRKVIKLISYILCFIMLISTFSACANDETSNTNGNTGGNGGGNTNTPSQNNTFVSSIPETENYLVKNGASDYVVVTSDNPVNWENQAAIDMVDNIKKATGVTLNVLEESSAQPTQKKIVIGKTLLTEAVNVSAPIETFGVRGFVVKEIDGSVYIVGGDTQGTLYGVYEFLHQQFGYEPYAIDEIFIETGVVEEKLLAFNMVEIPDIAVMQGVHEYYRFYNAAAGHRMRFNTYNEIFIQQDQPWHNVFQFISPREYDDPSKPETYHPKWFANQYELHYTAHGDLEELKLMQDTVYNKIVDYVESAYAEGKYYQYIGFMQNDHENVFATSDEPRKDASGNPLWENEPGHQDSIAALKAKYGESTYPAATFIHFVNPIQERLDQYLAEKYGTKVSIMFFAYFDTEAAPVVEENAVYKPMNIITSQDSSNPIFADDIYKDIYDGKTDGKLRLHPSSTVFTAPIRTEFWLDYEEDTAPSIIEKWRALADQQSFWFYNFYFNSCMFMYYDVAYSMQSYFKAAKSVNAQYLFFESPMTKAAMYPFGNLNVYLFSKLGWRVDMDVQKLIDDYFVNYYKDAAGSMREYFDSLTAYYAYLKNYTNFTGVIGAGGQNMNAKFWPAGVLQGWIDSINKAFKDIIPLKYTNKALYDELYSRILYESLSPRFLLLYFHAEDAFTDVGFVKEVAQLKADCASLGVTHAGDAMPDIQAIQFTR